MNATLLLLLLAVLPAKIDRAIAEKFPEAKVLKSEKEKDGSFEIDLRSKGGDFEVTMSAAGEVLAEERVVPLEATPAAVQKAIAALNEKPERIEQVTQKSQTLFEVVTRDSRGVRVETVFNADGSQKERSPATE